MFNIKHLIIISLILTSFATTKAAKIKMYILYTPSHDVLVNNYFKPSIKDNFELVSRVFDQKCPTANFNSKGWNDTMQDKVQVIINAIKENMGKIFIFSDVDIIFLQSIEKNIRGLMKTNDFVIQRSSIKTENACTGFFAIKGNDRILKLWKNIKKFMKKNKHLSEENVLNIFIQQGKLNKIKWKYLPVEYFNGGMLTHRIWSPGQALEIPKNILLHHANWTVGIENKIAQFEYVLNKLKNK